jgi:hypothetical protein
MLQPTIEIVDYNFILINYLTKLVDICYVELFK